MLDRTTIVDKNFIECVTSGQFPVAKSIVDFAKLDLEADCVIELFYSQLVSRHLDFQARILKEKNQSFYTIGSSGHECNAAVATAFRYTDMAFLHYRSGAFMVQRSKSLANVDPVKDMLLSLVASSDDPIAQGRHKVFGSLPLFVPPQTSTIASHLPKSVGAAFSIARAKELNLSAKLAYDSVILSSFGDASVNHSTAQGAFNAAQWIAYSHYPLPLVFICEDNGIGISVHTPENWVEDSISARPGIHYIKADGLSLLDTYRAAKQAEEIARHKKQPVFLHLKMVRLLGHAGSDIQQQYLTEEAIAQMEFDDPLLHSARMLIENQLLAGDEIIAMYEKVRKHVANTAEQVVKRPKLDSAEKVMASIVPPKLKQKKWKKVSEQERQQVFAEQYSQFDKPRNMSQLINLALTDLMLQYKNIVAFGEDVAKKGGVYRVTAGLMDKFGQRRVFDTLLDEQTILGTAIGMAHNGFLPIPEIQFLAYLHNAEDQLRGEAATLSFFSSGQYTNPMVIRIASLAYQKGFGGHFHNDNSIAVLRDLPGVIVACPSNGADAVRLLRTCVQLAEEEQRVVVFLELIALYMTKDLHTLGGNGWLCHYPKTSEKIAFGEVSVYGHGDDNVILAYGNGYYLARQAEKELSEGHDLQVKIVDLHWLSPLPLKAILREVANAKNVLIVDECRKSASVSEELITILVENLLPLPNLKRLTGCDTFIPLGAAWQCVLPSCEGIVNAMVKMVSGERYKPM